MHNYQQELNLKRQEEVAARIEQSKQEGSHNAGKIFNGMVADFAEHLDNLFQTCGNRSTAKQLEADMKAKSESNDFMDFWVHPKTKVSYALSYIMVDAILPRIFTFADRRLLITRLNENYGLSENYGALLIEEFCTLFSDKITRVIVSLGDNSKGVQFVATEEFAQELEDTDLLTIYRQKELWPMLEKPADWEGMYGNPYRDPLLARNLINRPGRGAIDVSKACEVVNALQSIPFQINPTVLSAATKAFKDGDLDVFKSSKFDSWEGRRLSRGNVTTTKRKLRHIFKAANFFLGKDFYVPYCIDFRGRVYPINSVLSSQGMEFEKALYMASKPEPVGEHGARELMIQLAGTFGHKTSLDERVSWAKAKLESGELAQWVEGTDKGWQQAEEPFFALATAEALVGWKASGYSNDYETAVLVFIDASNSGFQLLAGALRDESLAPHVNLVPAKEVGDLYSAVASEVTSQYDGEYDVSGRSLWKRPVMCLLYGLTTVGVIRYIKEGLGTQYKNNGAEDNKEIKGLADFFHAAMHAVAPQGYTVMGIFQKWASKLTKLSKTRNSLTISWTMPGGMVVHQTKEAFKKQKIDMRLASGERVRYLVKKKTGKIDVRGHVNSIAPNIIHSIDASLLWSTTLRMEGSPQLPCHDCFSTTAGNAHRLGQTVRQCFIDLVEDNPLGKIHQELETRYGIDLSDAMLPELGNLDLEAIKDTDHSFR